MLINTLCIGDVVGDPGREIVTSLLPDLIEKLELEFVVCNAENIAGGSGITPGTYNQLIEAGVDIITLGDHAFRKKQGHKTLEQNERIIRPANLPRTAVGKGVTVVDSKNGYSFAVVSLLGQLNFTSLHGDSPWAAADRILGELRDQTRLIIVDFHAEATSEKIAMGWRCNGKASIVFGTHTHVPTADATILDSGTAFITDVGMTGPYDSILGRCKDRVMKHLMTAMPHKFDVAEKDSRLYGLLTTLDPHSGNAVSSRLIRVSPDGTIVEFPETSRPNVR